MNEDERSNSAMVHSMVVWDCNKGQKLARM